MIEEPHNEGSEEKDKQDDNLHIQQEEGTDDSDGSSESFST